MTKLGFFSAAAVILSSALASPVMAQQVITDPGYCAQFYPNANCENNGPDNPYTGDYQLRNGWGSNTNWNNGWHDSRNDPWDRHYTAPFRGDSYAYYNDDSYGYYNNGYRGGPRQDYAPQNRAALNGFVCQPGTWYKGEDGRRHPCQ